LLSAMMRTPPGRSSSALGAAVLALALAPFGSASADVFDLSFQRFVLPPAKMGEFAEPGNTDNVDAGVLKAYRQVISEMSVALAPKVLTTADTIGYNGFQFTLDYSLTNISNQACGAGDVVTVGADPMSMRTVTAVDRCPWQYGVEGGRASDGG